MGRHSAHNDAPPIVSRRVLLGGGAVVVALLVVLALAFSGIVDINGGDGTTAADPGTSQTPDPTGAAPPAAAPPSSTPSVPTSAVAPRKRPPTLDLVLTGDSYVVVRVAGGRTLVEKVLRKGTRRTFDQKSLSVVLGNAAAVQVRVNGKLLTRGAKGQVKSFDARRK